MLFQPLEYFCANVDCVLHVRPGDSNVIGSGGNWAEVGGLVFDRARIAPDGPHYCHKCRPKLIVPPDDQCWESVLPKVAA